MYIAKRERFWRNMWKVEGVGGTNKSAFVERKREKWMKSAWVSFKSCCSLKKG